MNVYPQEVENHLLTHAAVADVAVPGIADAGLGKRAVALVEPRGWPADEAAFVDALDRHARAGLSVAKVPRGYVLRRSLERTETGKPMKRRLRDTLRPEQIVAPRKEMA